MFNTLGDYAEKLLGLILLFLLVFSSQSVFAISYSISAHGNSIYGVERNTTWASHYTQGNCAHCHGQHTASSDGYLLHADGFSNKTQHTYSTADSACFACHAGLAGSLQVVPFNNNDYSATFGGASATVTNIMDAFNLASYHNLNDVKDFITGNNGSKTFADFPAESNPCSGCHNVHMARANKRNIGNPDFTVMSRPSDHDNLWGDDPNDDASELMTSSSYGSGYQPPLRAGVNLEPDGASSVRATQAAKTPDYNALCTDCHNANNTIYSTTLLGRQLLKFDWSLEVHGEVGAVDWVGTTEMLAPYSDANLGDYVLSCMDCHEPHGSSNTLLIRRRVNSKTVFMPASANYWDEMCSSCHLAASDLKRFHHQIRQEAGYDCIDCHYSNTPNKDPVLLRHCYPCHHHGSSAGGFKTF